MNTPKPHVSMLVPIYNVGAYLEECLRSLEAQSYTNYEALLLDDGSSDESVEIAKSYADRDPRFLYIRKENSGYGDTLMCGLRRARGEYIGILESDDVMREGALMHMVSRVDATDCDVYHGAFMFWWSKTDTKKPYIAFNQRLVAYCTGASHPKPLRPVYAEHAFAMSLFLCMPSVWAGLYKRSFLQSHNIGFRPTKGAAFQDTSFVFKVYACAESCLVDNVPLINYRQDRETSSIHDVTKADALMGEYDEIFRWSDSMARAATTEVADGERTHAADYAQRLYALSWTVYSNGMLWYFDKFDACMQHTFAQRMSRHIRALKDTYGASLAGVDAWRSLQLNAVQSNPERFVRARERRHDSTRSKLHYAFELGGLRGVRAALQERWERR